MTERLLSILSFLAMYGTLTSKQIGYLLKMKNARLVRRLLQDAFSNKLINRTRMEVVPQFGSTAPAYFSAPKGLALLAELMQDESYLTKSTRAPDWTKLYHAVRLADFHIFLDEGVANQEAVKIEQWFTEFDVIDPTAREPEKRFTLYTLVTETPKRIVFNPDAAALMAFGKIKLAIYLELDRGTSSVNQIASSKTPAVPEMLARKLHRKHFPETTEEGFRILHVTTTPARRDLLRKGIASKKGAEVHRFVDWYSWEKAKTLWAPIFYTCEKGPLPLIPAPDQVGK